MEAVEALMGALFNASLAIVIVATMFSAGLSTTLSAQGKGEARPEEGPTGGQPAEAPSAPTGP